MQSFGLWSPYLGWLVLSCLQPDAIIDDTSFTFPFESYRDKDFILLGNATQLRKGQFRCKASSTLPNLQ